MDRSILKLLEQDGRLTAEQIALMCGKEVGDVKVAASPGRRF